MKDFDFEGMQPMDHNRRPQRRTQSQSQSQSQSYQEPTYITVPVQQRNSYEDYSTEIPRTNHRETSRDNSQRYSEDEEYQYQYARQVVPKVVPKVGDREPQRQLHRSSTVSSQYYPNDHVRDRNSSEPPSRTSQSSQSSQSDPPKFDPYLVLGVTRACKLSDIKKVYYRLVKRYHPDGPERRTRENAEKMAMVTKAYNILSDPTQRALYDNAYTADHGDLRTAYDNFSALQQKQVKVDAKQKFAQNDLDTFNKEFERNRAKDPNDHGYGDDMATRLDASELVGGQRRNDYIPPPENLFGGQQFDHNTFNRMFEQMNEHTTGSALMERSEEDPSGFSLLGGTGAGFSEISVYNGAMIVGKELDDYSRQASQLGYGDYKRSYHHGQNPSKIDKSTLNEIKSKKNPYEDTKLTTEETKRLYAERMKEFTQPLIDIPQDDRKRRYQEQEWRLQEEREAEVLKQQEKDREVVFKYKDQFPQHLLADLNIREAHNPLNDPSRNPVTDSQRDYRQQRSYDDLMKERMKH